MSIEWKDTLSIGNDIIDDDHRQLIKLINEYEEAVAKKDLNILDHAFQGLEDYANEHFRREEQMMEAVHYPQRRSHYEVHRELLRTVTAKHDQIREHKSLSITELSEFLRAWLIDHVIKEDMKLKPYLKGGRKDNSTNIMSSSK